MFQRVAISEQYEGNPTRIRREWAFFDFLDACVILDAFDAEKARRAAEGNGG